MEARLSIVGVGLPVAVDSTTARTDAATDAFIVAVCNMVEFQQDIASASSRHKAWISAALYSCRRGVGLLSKQGRLIGFAENSFMMDFQPRTNKTLLQEHIP